MTGIKKWQLTLLAAVCMTGPAWAAKIAAVKIEQEGKIPQKEEVLLYNISQKAGQEYDQRLVGEDIRRLAKTGYFRDVTAETRPLPNGDVELVFVAKLNPVLEEIVFKGNQKFTKDDLVPLLTVTSGTLLNNAQLQASISKIREFYREKGYNEARITPVLEKIAEDTLRLVIHIEEHLRLKVNDVVFEGATVYSQRELRNTIQNSYSMFSWLDFLGLGLYDPAVVELDEARLRDLYWNKGYLDFKVDKLDVTQIPDDPEFVDMTYFIQEGEPYSVSGTELSGNQVFTTEELNRFNPFADGDVYDLAKEQDFQKQILNNYERYGYADADVRVVRDTDFANKTVKLRFEINEGRKYTVNRVNITGNQITREDVIRRELVIHDGDVLDKQRIEASKSRLMGMGYFNKVEAITSNADKVGERNINFNVEEKDFYQFKIGAGYSDFDSLSGMVEISNTNFDITNPSNYFQGGGQRIRLQGIGGLERSQVNLDFTEPWLFGEKLRYDLSFYLNQIDYEYWREDRFGTRTALTRNFFDDFTSATLGYKFERVSVKDMDRGQSEEMRELQTHDWVSQFSLLLNRDTRDSLYEPTSGYQISALSALAMKIFGSSHNFYRLEAKGSYYHSFFDKAIIWHIGGKIGVIDDFDSDNTVPLYERYFLGGGDTLRGFPYREVSPTDCNDHGVGGSTMLLLSTEASHPIWSFIRGAVFVDAGSVWSDSYSMSMNRMNVGTGYGLRIKVPYLNMPVKLDLAYPVVNNVDGLPSKLRFHFNMGFTWNPASSGLL